MAGAVARYDADSRGWQMLGGNDYEHGVKTLIWNPGGASAYQGYKVRLTHVGVFADGQPATFFMSGGAELSRWVPGGGWSSPDEFPASFPARFVTDDRGVITAVGSGALHRSFDGGRTWRRYSADTGSVNACMVDYCYLARTGQLCYHAQSGGMVRVYTARFSERGRD